MDEPEPVTTKLDEALKHKRECEADYRKAEDCDDPQAVITALTRLRAAAMAYALLKNLTTEEK